MNRQQLEVIDRIATHQNCRLARGSRGVFCRDHGVLIAQPETIHAAIGAWEQLLAQEITDA